MSGPLQRGLKWELWNFLFGYVLILMAIKSAYLGLVQITQYDCESNKIF